MEVNVGQNKATTSAIIDNEDNRNKPKWNSGTANGHLRDGLQQWDTTENNERARQWLPR
jgi:hypothetical protein